MNKSFATLLSYLLHPVVYPLLGLLVIVKALPFHINSSIVLLSLTFVFVGTYVIPLALSFLLYRMELIAGLDMKSARDRRLPYFIAALCFYFTSLLIQKLQLPEEAYLFLLSSALVIVIHLSMLYLFKPSAHLGGIGGFTGLLIKLSWTYEIGFLTMIAACFLLAGFLGSARLYLKAHTPAELIIGYAVGFVVVLLVV